MKYRNIMSAIICAIAAACGESGPEAFAPEPALSLSAGSLLGDVASDSTFVSADAQLASTCSGDVTDNYAVLFGHTGCLIVTPTGSTYSLTDDVVIGITMKRGKITALQVRGQDVIGADGIKHESEVITLAVPVKPDPAGFVLHVHADGVPVYRLSGHVNGRRVEMIGTIAVGDIIYRQP